MLSVAIVEDDKTSADRIKDFIEKFEKETGETFTVSHFFDGEDIVADYKPRYQIIFLDVQMARLDGMRTAEIIREVDKDVILIFITNMAQYAIKGYSVNALDFLVKPVSYFAFSEQLKRSVEQVESRRTSYLLIPSENGMARISTNRIVFIESFRHQIIVHSKEGDYTMTSSMTEMENRLKDKDFFRVAKSYLVNLAFVTDMQGSTATLDKKHELSVGRAFKKPFLDALTIYVSCRNE